MKRILICAALATAVAVGATGEASAWGHGWGGHGWGGHGWGGHGFFRGPGFRAWGPGWGYPYYSAYGGCWRWVPFPVWHRVWVCY
jgi:hypothetical protein